MCNLWVTNIPQLKEQKLRWMELRIKLSTHLMPHQFLSQKTTWKLWIASTAPTDKLLAQFD